MHIYNWAHLIACESNINIWIGLHMWHTKSTVSMDR
jgi:hypothetical protein